MAILHLGKEERGLAWREAFARELPEVDFRCSPEEGELPDVRHLVAWTIPLGMIEQLPNPEVIFSIPPFWRESAAARRRLQSSDGKSERAL